MHLIFIYNLNIYFVSLVEHIEDPVCVKTHIYSHVFSPNYDVVVQSVSCVWFVSCHGRTDNEKSKMKRKGKEKKVKET